MKRAAFDKYDLYRRAVQDPEGLVELMDSAYRGAFRKRALTFREDFCGTFFLGSEWVRSHPRRTATGIDRDPKPLAYATRVHPRRLGAEAWRRVRLRRADVLSGKLPTADVIGAFNFSHFGFHSRKQLREYFSRCWRSLPRRGLLVMDCLSGLESRRGMVDRVEYDDFVYYWEQASFDPITRRAKFFIHFERPGEARRDRVFTYDWRLWTVPELRDLLEEVGFRRTNVYWEGLEEAWVAYLVAIKR